MGLLGRTAQNLVVRSVSQSGKAATSALDRPIETRHDGQANDLPVLTTCTRPLRQRSMVSRETTPSGSRGIAAPIPDAAITIATWGRLWPWAASTAAPSVGPTQGFQAAPTSPPRTAARSVGMV
jgi:hypothetical protein